MRTTNAAASGPGLVGHVDVGRKAENRGRPAADGEAGRALSRVGDDVLPHEDEGEPPPHRAPERESRCDEEAGVGDRRERRGEESRRSDVAGSGGERGAASGTAVRGSDDADRREHGRCGKLPARHGLQPEVDEQAVVDEVSDRRGAEPERRERDEDPEPVVGDDVAAAWAGLSSQRAKRPIRMASAPSPAMPSRRVTVICMRSSSR